MELFGIDLHESAFMQDEETSYFDLKTDDLMVDDVKDRFDTLALLPDEPIFLAASLPLEIMPKRKPVSSMVDFSFLPNAFVPTTTPSPPPSPPSSNTNSKKMGSVNDDDEASSSADIVAVLNNRKKRAKPTVEKRRVRKRRKRSPEMDEKKKEEKRLRNRILAQQSRDRRKRYIADLEAHNKQLAQGSETLVTQNVQLASAAKRQFVLALFLAMAWLVTSPVRDSIVDQLKVSLCGVAPTESPYHLVSEAMANNLRALEQDVEQRLPAAVKNAVLSTRSANATMLAGWVSDIPRAVAVTYWPSVVSSTMDASQPISPSESEAVVAHIRVSSTAYLFFVLQAALGATLAAKPKPAPMVESPAPLPPLQRPSPLSAMSEPSSPELADSPLSS